MSKNKTIQNQIKNMKKITFESLRLLNFCGIRDARYDFGGHSVIISARNGAGKSTIAKAISYVLFVTDLRGNQFEIKTYDSNHRIIPEIEHSAELIMSVDGEPITLKRTLKDSWKGEQVKNTYTYFIDGDAVSAGDFKKKVDSICPEITFRLASSPIFFLSKPWTEQRQFLESLAPARGAEDVTDGDARFDPVVEALKKEPIDKLVSHLKYRKSEVQKLLDDVPTRLAELDKALPEKQDWEALKAEKAKLQSDYESTSQQLSKAKNGDANKVFQEGTLKRLEFAEKRKREMEKSARKQAGEEEVKHGSDLINARTTQQKASSMVSELQDKMDGFTDTEVHIKQQIEDAKAKVKNLNTQLHAVTDRKWEWDDKDNFCPHCGQPLPMDKLAQIKQESAQRFNERKANDLKALKEEFAQLNGEYNEANKLLAQLDEDRKITTNQLVEAQKALKEADKHLADVKADEPKGESMILGENPTYKQVIAEIADLNNKLENPAEADNEEQQKLITDLAFKAEEIHTTIISLDAKLSFEKSYLNVSQLIEAAQADKKKFQEQIDELNDKLGLATEYYEKSCSILEEEVNKHFSFVKWSMFKSNLDGDKKPFCECYHDGVPYSSLNTSAKINAGIDIANTIASYYSVAVPIILDNCESNLHPLYSLGQQIRLSVTHDEEITITQISEADAG